LFHPFIPVRIILLPRKKNLLAYDIEIFEKTPLKDISLAVKDEDSLRIEAFFKKNKKLINIQEPKFKFTLLMWSVFNHRYGSANALLKSGADPNICSKNGTSPLIRAAAFDKLHMMKLLVNYGANPKYTHDSLMPPNAIIASAWGDPNLDGLKKVKFLVELGVNIDSTNNLQGTALHNAIIQGGFDIAEYLIYKGANLNIPVDVYPNGKKVYCLKKLKKMKVEPYLLNRKEDLIKYVEKHIDTTGTK
jgi:ankyrin repeat protein